MNYSVLFNVEYCTALILTGRDFVTSLKPGFYQFNCWIKILFPNKERPSGLHAYIAIPTNYKDLH